MRACLGHPTVQGSPLGSVTALPVAWPAARPFEAAPLFTCLLFMPVDTNVPPTETSGAPHFGWPDLRGLG